jgi:hypothetical protein
MIIGTLQMQKQVWEKYIVQRTFLEYCGWNQKNSLLANFSSLKGFQGGKYWKEYIHTYIPFHFTSPNKWK